MLLNLIDLLHKIESFGLKYYIPLHDRTNNFSLLGLHVNYGSCLIIYDFISLFLSVILCGTKFLFNPWMDRSKRISVCKSQ